MSSRNNILLLALCGLISACATPKVVQDYQRDSVAVEVRDSLILRDSVIFVEVPKESDKAVLPDADTSRLETSLALSEAWVNEGRLYHTLRNRHEALIPIEVKLPKYLHSEREYLIREKQVTVEVEKELSRWQSFIQSLGYAVLIAGAAWLAWKLSKIVRL